MGETDTPPLCLRIRRTRERLQDEWKADNPGERGNPFTQERVAARIGLTTKSYGDFERFREPDMRRLREIAQALGLDEDYFTPSGDLAAATARLEAETERIRRVGDEMDRVLGLLQARLPAERPARAPGEPD